MTQLIRTAMPALAILFLTAGVSPAQKKPGAPSVAGTVKAVDASANTITLEGKKKKDGTTDPDQTVAVAKDAKINVDGEAKALADVKVGAKVHLILTADRKTATAANVTGETIAGTVKAVDATAGTITLEGKKKKNGTTDPDQTIAVAKSAKVSIDGEAKTLADVKAGVQATLALTVDQKTALAVNVGGKKKGNPGAPTVGGTVKAVDASANTITLAGQKKKDGTTDPDRTVAVAKDAKVSVDGEAKALADVKVGERANLILTADQKTATAVVVGGKKKGSK